MKKTLPLYLLSCCLLFSSWNIKAEGLSFDIIGQKAFMMGEIGATTLAELQQLFSGHPQVNTIVMVDVPGSNDDEAAIPAYSLIRNNNIHIEVESDGEIASGGVDFFIAGASRTVAPGGKIGVHAWSDGETSAADLPEDHPDHDLFIEYYELMGLPDPEGFYFFTINAAPPEDIYFMSMEELHQFGLITKARNGSFLSAITLLLLP